MRSTQQLLAAGTTLAVAALLGAVIMVAVRALRRHAGDGVRARCASLAAPLATLALSVGTLTAVGWMADRSGWYSPAAAALPSGGLGGALTLWARGIVAAVTPAWVHPGLFGQMPAGEIAAAVAAPVAAVAASAAVLRLSIRLPAWLPRRRHAVIAVATVGAMFLSAAATARWLLSAPHLAGTISSAADASRLSPGHTPWAVIVALVALTALAAVGARRVLQGRPPTSPLPGKPRSLPAGDRPPRGGWSVGTRRFAPVAADQ